MTVKPKVLLMGPMPYVREEFFARVSPLADIVELSSSDLAEFERDISTKYQGLTAIYHYRNPGGKFGYLDEAFFKVLPDSCHTVCHLGAGYDDIDVHAAQRYGVRITNTPSAVDDATATTCVYLILSAMRRFAKAESQCRAGSWKNNLPLARDPEHKILGIVGMGGIGTVVAQRMALGWGMKVIYHNRRPVAEESLGFEAEYKSSLDDLLREADVVSLHAPMNASTKGMIGGKQFDLMKSSAVIVNTARGGLVDQEALIQALETNQVYGAGLDVYPDEPRIDDRFFTMDNVTLLPHMGTETVDTRDKMGLMVLTNILDALKGEALHNQVPEQL